MYVLRQLPFHCRPNLLMVFSPAEEWLRQCAYRWTIANIHSRKAEMQFKMKSWTSGFVCVWEVMNGLRVSGRCHSLRSDKFFFSFKWAVRLRFREIKPYLNNVSGSSLPHLLEFLINSRSVTQRFRQAIFIGSSCFTFAYERSNIHSFDETIADDVKTYTCTAQRIWQLL